MRTVLVATTWVSVLLVAITGVALAWPDQLPSVAPLAVKPKSDTLLSSEVTAPSALETNARTNDLFFVRPDGAKGSLIVYDMPSGQRRFTLPAGVLSADRKHYFAAMPYPYPGEAATIVTLFDPGTGKPYYKFPVNGQWDLSGVSPSGRWVALTRLPSEDEKQTWTKVNQWQTDIRIVESETGKTTHILSLDGNFEVETISADGNSLFLVQHLPAIHPDHYLIRLYDLSAEQLQADPLRAKGADEVMAGLAWDGVASLDGHWLLTLYLSTRRDVAFVHTLDLQNKFPVCIDLPSGSGDLDQLKYYNLALSPDGQTIYATNAVLGVVAEVELTTRQVVRTVKFTPSSAVKTTAYGSQAPTSRSVVSEDGQTVYFTSGTGVWVYDAPHGQVNGPYSTDMQVLGLGLSVDGKQLYVASADETTRAIDAASIQKITTNVSY
jgi:WD40 repeat protein